MKNKNTANKEFVCLVVAAVAAFGLLLGTMYLSSKTSKAEYGPYTGTVVSRSITSSSTHQIKDGVIYDTVSEYVYSITLDDGNQYTVSEDDFIYCIGDVEYTLTKTTTGLTSETEFNLKETN